MKNIDDFQGRRKTAVAAKARMLAKLAARPGADDPAVIARAAERRTIDEARKPGKSSGRKWKRRRRRLGRKPSPRRPPRTRPAPKRGAMRVTQQGNCAPSHRLDDPAHNGDLQGEARTRAAPSQRLTTSRMNSDRGNARSRSYRRLRAVRPPRAGTHSVHASCSPRLSRQGFSAAARLVEAPAPTIGTPLASADGRIHRYAGSMALSQPTIRCSK